MIVKRFGMRWPEVRVLYSLAAWAAQPLLRRKLRRRAVAEPGYGEHVDERFGRYSLARPAGDGPLVWIHAVSLGETRAAAILLAALRQRLPGMRLLLTHGTATGRAEGRKLLRDGDVQVWQPWDTRGAVRRFFTHFRPDVGVLMETEIWPNLIHQARAQSVPLALANVIGDHRTQSLAAALIQAHDQQEAALKEVLAGAASVVQSNELRKQG